MISFFSTFEVNGIRITAGKPPAKPDLDWARIHLMVTDPDYYGKIRVLLYNLRQGVADDPAYRNAFGKSVRRWRRPLRSISPRGISRPRRSPAARWRKRDFPERQVSDAEARLARADLLAGAQSAAEYQKLLAGHEKVAEAEEGLGLLALREGRKDEARKNFAAAMEAGSTSARCFIEYAKLEPDKTRPSRRCSKRGHQPQARRAIRPAGQRDTDPRKRVMHWKAAAERDPRNPAYWKALAEIYLADHNYGEAAKAWRSGEQAATDPAERERMRQARMSIEQQRLDYEEAEKRRDAEEKARESKNSRRRRAPNSARPRPNSTRAHIPPGDKAVPWWDGPEARRQGQRHAETGRLPAQQQARLTIEDASQKIVKLLVADRRRWSYTGSGEVSLGCGVQKPRKLPSNTSRKPTPGWPPPAKWPPSSSSDSAHERARDTAGWCSRYSCSPPRSISWTARRWPHSPRPLKQEFGLTNAQYGWITSAFNLTYAAERAAGRNVDRQPGSEPRRFVRCRTVVLRRNRDRLHARPGRAGGLPRGARCGGSGAAFRPRGRRSTSTFYLASGRWETPSTRRA